MQATELRWTLVELELQGGPTWSDAWGDSLQWFFLKLWQGRRQFRNPDVRIGQETGAGLDQEALGCELTKLRALTRWVRKGLGLLLR